ncbi:MULTISPECIES: DUF6714 family protein [unclassified Bradyrhizobium]|uniref:DUF6714 family protein n=1 Tax=unclassified Bradyrhizobium TaxID=2631580 RepID=UPI001BA8CE4E|nr:MULTISPECIES: DUF6714 family protein [unclassified Bradyrhizobium]MBR1201936.1 hypothetical protein [Bradyrhizobium sp. AUGA SZCCT0124]MBR1311495.1 hypothetical protein [Bradyrhizobium sp. AUGA SZCCT0051]MBR1338885.1 hypothetical protein [Bradyrhizobium sp. AUGA SZCCT0105]MBR1353459.1 hypothetical protein [Bradyrhizobium sp. AUGA SZCCT0045]
MRKHDHEQFSKLLTATFPPHPMPAQFFWREDRHDNSYEFRRDLLEWLAERQWTEIKMRDWAMAGHLSITRELLEPATFLYYLPSLLLGVIEDPGYLESALVAIIPSARDRRPKSKWWGELLETISPDQSAAIRAFLAYIRNNLLRSGEGPFVISMNEALTTEAETFWDAQILSSTSRTK